MGIIKKWNDTVIRLRYSGKDEEGIKAKPKRGIKRNEEKKEITIYYKVRKGIKSHPMFLYSYQTSLIIYYVMYILSFSFNCFYVYHRTKISYCILICTSYLRRHLHIFICHAILTVQTCVYGERWRVLFPQPIFDSTYSNLRTDHSYRPKYSIS